MTDQEWTRFEDAQGDMRDRLLDAALPEIAFDGWGETALAAAARACGISMAEARRAFPRGGVDMALAFHGRADAQLKSELAGERFGGMRVRDKIAEAVKRRLEIVAPEKEAVRRGVTLFALPINAPEGAKALWRTADIIWSGIGDTSRDGNWYSKRAILSGVYSSSMLYWLGDASPDFAETRGFIDRRIDGVIRFEKGKAALNKNPLGKLAMAGPNFVMSLMKAPGEGAARRSGSA